MSPPDVPTKATTSGSPSPSSLPSSSSSLLFKLPLKEPLLTSETGNDSSLVDNSPVSNSPSPSSASPSISSLAKGSNSTNKFPPANSSSPVLGLSLTAPLPSPPAPNPKPQKYKPESLTQSPLPQPRPPPSPHPISSPPPAPTSPPPSVVPDSPPPPPTKRSSPPLSPRVPSAPPPSVSLPVGPAYPTSTSSPSPPHTVLAPPPPHAHSEPPPLTEGASPPTHSSPSVANSTGSPSSTSISVSPSRNRTNFAASSVSVVPPPHHSSSKSPSSSSSSTNSTSQSAESTSSSSLSLSSMQTTMLAGATLAGIVIIALVATVFVLSRKKSKRSDVYPSSYAPPPNFTVQSDGYYYGQNSSVMAVPAHSDAFFPSQAPYSGSSLGSQRGKVYHGGGPESELLTGTKSFYSYEEVMEMTGGFAHQNIIGQGGFGSVYKGQLSDGRVVAVKQLKVGSGQGDREFRAEVEIISRVHHRHLVSLVGYCIQDNQRLLIYEFLPNKTLDYHLHGEGLPVLDWRKRVKIALGASKGLAYLHEDCHPKIIHRDIKSSNILLDDAFESQVSDFGLAKLTNDTSTHVSTRVMGTFGYLAPEYASSGKLTDRSDVFSFGVVLLELITGRKPVDPTQPLGDESLVEWSRPLLIQALETGDVSEVVDRRLDKHYVESEMLRMIEAAAACIRHSATKRPRMAQVVRALDSDAEMSDLTNGVKYGQSTIYDSGQYSEDIMKFRRMAHGSNSSLDLGSSSREHALSGVPSPIWKSKDSSSDFTSSESETKAFKPESPQASHRHARNSVVWTRPLSINLPLMILGRKKTSEDAS